MFNSKCLFHWILLNFNQNFKDSLNFFKFHANFLSFTHTHMCFVAFIQNLPCVSVAVTTPMRVWLHALYAFSINWLSESVYQFIECKTGEHFFRRQNVHEYLISQTLLGTSERVDYIYRRLGKRHLDVFLLCYRIAI